jgi:hypothetical protein
VDREHALAEIPMAYAIALRLEARGVDRHLIAADLGVEPEAVEALLRLAHAKLASVMEQPVAGSTDTWSTPS